MCSWPGKSASSLPGAAEGKSARSHSLALIASLGQRGVGLEPAHDSDPVAQRGLPLIEVLAAHITAVNDLVSVGERALDLYLNGGIDHGREAAGHRPELEPDIRHILALRQAERLGTEADGVVVAREQVACEHSVVVGIGLEGDPIVEPLVIGAGREAHGIGSVRGEPTRRLPTAYLFQNENATDRPDAQHRP